MYTEKDLSAINSQQSKRWLVVGAICLVLIAGIVYSLIIRLEAFTSGLTIVLGIVLIFGYDLFIKPLHRYAVFLDNALHGRKHTVECTYQGMDADISLVDGVRYYSMTVLQQDEGEDEPFERFFYWDAQRPQPQAQPGDKLHVTYHDRMVTDLTIG